MGPVDPGTPARETSVSEALLMPLTARGRVALIALWLMSEIVVGTVLTVMMPDPTITCWRPIWKRWFQQSRYRSL